MKTCDFCVALMLACALGACQPTADAEPQPATQQTNDPTISTAPPAERFEDDMVMRFHMSSSFDVVRGIERLLIRGKLDDARYFARSLASEGDPPGMAPWGKQITAVRERAAAVATAPSIDEACRREARLAAACASCHADTSAQPEFGPPPALPADQQTVESRMARHQWAADRIWEGMIGDADDSWQAGLDVLAEAPLSRPKVGSDREGMARRLQQLASQARHPAKKDLDERARLYGEILVTCAACHMPAN